VGLIYGVEKGIPLTYWFDMDMGVGKLNG